MCPLYYPPTCSKASLTFEGVRFFPTRPNRRREAKHGQRSPPLLVVVPLIQTQALGLRGGRLGPFDHNAIESRRKQFHIRPSGAGHDYAQRHALARGQAAALDAAFAPIRGVGAGFFPRPTALWSGHRPYLTTASLRLSAPRTAPRPRARVAKTRLRRPNAESDRGRWSGDTSPWRLRRPTDSRCAARSRGRRHPADRGCAACRRQTEGCSRAAEFRPAARPTTFPTRENLSSLCSPALASVPFWSVPCPQCTTSRLSG